MKRFALAAMFLVPAVVFAGGNSNSNNSDNVTNNNQTYNNGGSARSSANATNIQGQAQGQIQGQSQSARTGDISIGGDTYKERYQAPGMAGLPSGPCTGASGNVVVPGFGFGAGMMDAECDKRETARVLMEAGRIQDAHMVLDNLQALKDAREAKKPKPVAVEHSGL